MEWIIWLIIGSILFLFLLFFGWFRSIVGQIIRGMFVVAGKVIIGLITLVIGLWLAYWVFIKYLL